VGKKRVSFEEFKKRATNKIITDGKLREFTLPLNDEEDLAFQYKPISKSEYLTAQATMDAGKALDHILTHSLWDQNKGENGDFFSIEDINDLFDYNWQTLILNGIINGSGHVLTEKDKDF
jgi:hypothetical protein